MRACTSSCSARSVSRHVQRATRRTPSASTGFHPVPWHSGQSFLVIVRPKARILNQAEQLVERILGRPRRRRDGGFPYRIKIRSHATLRLPRERKLDLSIYYKSDWSINIRIVDGVWPM